MKEIGLQNRNGALSDLVADMNPDESLLRFELYKKIIYQPKRVFFSSVINADILLRQANLN